jgi:Protein of unknown function (DUF2934)
MKPRSRKSRSTPEPVQISEAIRSEIAEKAYARFQNRGASHGYHLEDWLEAEREVLSRLNAGSDKKVRPLVPRPRTRRKKTVEDQP